MHRQLGKVARQALVLVGVLWLSLALVGYSVAQDCNPRYRTLSWMIGGPTATQGLLPDKASACATLTTLGLSLGSLGSGMMSWLGGMVVLSTDNALQLLPRELRERADTQKLEPLLLWRLSRPRTRALSLGAVLAGFLQLVGLVGVALSPINQPTCTEDADATLETMHYLFAYGLSVFGALAQVALSLSTAWMLRVHRTLGAGGPRVDLALWAQLRLLRLVIPLAALQLVAFAAGNVVDRDFVRVSGNTEVMLSVYIMVSSSAAGLAIAAADPATSSLAVVD